MRLKESIRIQARADQVWEYVGSPEVWPLFHSKAGECTLLSLQADVIGARYEMEFRLGNKTSPTQCEIVDLHVGRMIQLRSQLREIDKKTRWAPSAVMTYELEDLGFETKVSERVDLDLPGINVLLRLLMWLFMRLGKPSGETSLVRLKRILEEA